MRIHALQPFGALVSPADEDIKLLTVNSRQLQHLMAKYALLIFRNFEAIGDTEFIEFAEKFGEVLTWEFGPILELKINRQPRNHIFANGRVELHWDGAFIEKKPRFNFFNCINGSPPEFGGETLFVDTRKVLREASEGQLDAWRKITIEYSTEKKAHYGGKISEPLIKKDKASTRETIRYIEAFNEDSDDINPMQVRVLNYAKKASDDFLNTLNAHLYSRRYMYAHGWRAGDLLIADNSVLLHGRNKFHQPGSQRLIKRINVL